MKNINSHLHGRHNLSLLAIAIRRALPALVFASLPVYAAVTIPSQNSTYILSGTEPFVMPSPNNITVSTGSAISGGNAQDWQLTINDGATIQGGNFGINLGAATGGTAINLSGDITSSVSSSGGNAAGVKLNNGGTLNILSTGSINSSSDGVYLTTGGTVNNSGSVSGASGGTSVYFNSGTGIYSGVAGSVIGGGYGIIVNGGSGSVTNAGNISVLRNGVWFRSSAGGTLTNQTGGVISSSSASDFGVNIASTGGVNITNAGEIAGNTGIVMSSGGNTLLNSGNITGSGGTAIQLSGSNNAVTLTSGSNISGNITATGSGNTLTLKGQGALGSNVSGLDSVTASGDAGTIWALNGATMSTTGTTAAALLVQSGTLILNGDLTHGGAGGGSTINGDAVLQLGNNSASGSVTGNVVDNGTLRFSRTDVATFDGLISGTGGVEQAGSGETTLTGANSYSGGSVVNAGTLNAASVDALGVGSSTIGADGALELSFTNGTFASAISNAGLLNVTGASNTLSSAVTGAGENRISGTGTLLTGDNSGFTGSWNILSDGSATISATQNLGAATVQLNGLLNVTPASGGYTFSNALTGAGEMAVALASGNTFAFANSVGSAYAGLVRLGSSQFTLSDDNTTALTNATLQLDTGNLTTVGAGTQTIGNLNFNGGTAMFSALPLGTINTGQLALTLGKVQIDPTAITNTSHNLLTADDGAGLQLIAATGVSGAAANITLLDMSGTALNASSTSQSDITQGGNTVAVGTWSGFALNDNHGLGVGYTLTQLDLQNGQTLTLSGDATSPDGAGDMKALISGSGNLTVNATDAITLANGGNSYTGATTVTGGTLRAGAENVIADSSQLNLNSGTTFNLNGFDQSVNNLNGAGNVTLGAMALTVNTAAGVTIYGGVIDGSGTVTTAGPGAWIVTGDNSWSGGTTLGAGVLQLGSGGTSGGLTGDIVNNAALVVNRSNALTLDGVISGSGTVTQAGAGQTILSGANSYSGATTVSAGSLIAASATALGSGAATVADGATLNLTFTGGTFGNAIANAGLLDVTGAGNTLNSAISGDGVNRISAPGTVIGGNNTLFTGNWNIINGASANVSAVQNLGDAAVQLEGTLNIAPASGDYTVANTLTGGGLIAAGLASGNSFAFASTVGSAFSGTLQLGQSRFDLSGDNTRALTNATLQLDSNSETTVGAGTQTIDNLTMNGGALIFNGETPPGQPDGMVQVADLTLNSGEVRVEAPTAGIPNPAPSGQNLMAEDDEMILSQLVSASGTVTGGAGSLTLADHDGNAISNPQQFAIAEGGTAVANAGYDYTLTTGDNNDGLYVNYGLKTLDLLSGQTLHLTPDAGATGAAATLSAQVTGVGNLDVDASAAGAQTVTLDNGSNSYTGATTVSGGTLRLGSDQALGATRLLTVNSGASADVNGKTQTIGALGGDGGLGINGGNLTIRNGGTFGGVASGSLGTLNLTGGTLALTGSNTFSGLTTIHSGATMRVGTGGTTGSFVGPVVDNGLLRFNRSDNVALTGAVTGSGELHQDGAGTLFVNNDVRISGPVTIGAGTLSIGDGVTDGSVTSNIVNDSALVFNRSDWSYGGVISGSGTVEQRSASQTTLTGANSWSGDTTVSAGALNAANVSALGASVATVANGATLALSFVNGVFNNLVVNNGILNVTDGGNTLNGDIAGTGVNRISAQNTLIAGDNSGFSGSWDITSSGLATVTAAENLGSAAVQLSGVLNVAPTSGDFTFSNALTGDGVLAASLGSSSDAFNFAATAGNAFAGIVALRRGGMALAGDNVSALGNATLALGAGGIATLDSDQTIGDLSFNGGMLDVAMTSPSTANILTVNNLNVDAADAPSTIGVVNLRAASLTPGNKPAGNFLDQDNAIDNGIQVVSATAVSSEGKQLTLLMNGAAPGDDVYQVSDGFGHNDVLATYGYSTVVTKGRNAPGGPGLYAGYLLKVLNSQSTAVLDTTGASDTTLGAQLTGVGDFEFRANDGVITLVNAANDYQGKTLLTSGTLLLGDNNTLGQTSALNIAAAAIADLNGYRQTIGALNGAAGSTLALNGGDLTITEGGQSDGALTGGGNLILDGAELTIGNANDALSAAVAVNTDATARLKNTGGLGSGNVALAGTLAFDAATGAFANPLQGAGALNLVNGSDVTLAGNNSGYSGNIDINDANRLSVQQPANLGSAAITNDGELLLNAGDNWTFSNAMSGSGLLTKAGAGTVNIASDYGHTGGTHVAAGTLALDNPAALSGGGPVTVDSGATLGGYGVIVGNVTSRGTVAAGDAIASLTNGPGNLTIHGNLDNFNTVKLAGNSVGNTLTVAGNYTAHSTLVLNTVLGGDASATDKLIVKGDTSGHTDVYVNNKGGSGAQTTNGIRVIEVDGASNGDFTLANRVVAGAYDYQLLQGMPSGNDGDWYLRVPLEQPVVPVRPEAGAYLGNQGAAIDMFSHSLHDRLGESLFVTGNGEQVNAPSAWIRVFGSRTNSQSAGQIDQDTWSNGMQLGFDLANNLQVQNRWQVGVMAGYGSARTRNKTAGQRDIARSDVDGYSVGVYGTWFADGRPAGTGPYIDTWAQYGWYNNKVNGDGLPEQKYDSRTQAVSVEGGWAFNVYNTSQMSFFIQPQEQVIYTHYDADNVKEDNGTEVKNRNNGGFGNRLGMRVYGYSADKKGRQWQPFIEANWLYSGYTSSITMNGQRLDADTPKHRYEVKAGVEARLSQQWNLWGNIGTQQGSDDYRSIEGGVGVKYTW